MTLVQGDEDPASTKKRALQMVQHLKGSCHLRLTRPLGFAVTISVKPFANVVANYARRDRD